MTRTTLLGLAVLLGGLGAGPAGCIAVGGTSPQPTVGQQLIDLKAALDRGAVTPPEYEAKKAQLLAGRP